MQNIFISYLILLNENVFFFINKQKYNIINFLMFDYNYYFISLHVTLATQLSILKPQDMFCFLKQNKNQILITTFTCNTNTYLFLYVFKNNFWSCEHLQPYVNWIEREIFEYFNIKFLFKMDTRVLYLYRLNYLNYIWNSNLIYWCY